MSIYTNVNSTSWCIKDERIYGHSIIWNAFGAQAVVKIKKIKKSKGK